MKIIKKKYAEDCNRYFVLRYEKDKLTGNNHEDSRMHDSKTSSKVEEIKMHHIN